MSHSALEPFDDVGSISTTAADDNIDQNSSSSSSSAMNTSTTRPSSPTLDSLLAPTSNGAGGREDSDSVADMEDSVCDRPPSIDEDEEDAEMGFGGEDDDAGFGDDGDDGGFGDEDDDDAGDWGDDAEFSESEDTLVLANAARPNTLPERTTERVREDIDELQLLNRFHAVYKTADSGGLVVRIGIDITRTELTDEQIEAWNIGDNTQFVIQLNSNPNYLWAKYSPEFKIYAGDITDVSEGFDEKGAEFALGWTIEDRINKSFFTSTSWPPQKHELEPDLKFSDVREVMEASGSSYLIAATSYQSCNKNRDQAILVATDEHKRDHVMSASGKKSIAEQNLAMLQIGRSKFIDDEDENPHEFTRTSHELTETFNVHPDVVALALERCVSGDEKHQRKNARKMLADNKKRHALKEEVQHQHLLKRTRQFLVEHNLLVQLALFVETTLLTIKLQCDICQKLQFVGWKPGDKNQRKDFCNCPFQGVGFGLTKGIRAHSEIVDLLISMTYAAVHADRIKNCFPDDVQYQGQTFVKSNNEPNLVRLKACLAKCPTVAKMQEWLDKGILKHELLALDPLLFSLLQWVLSSSQARIQRLRPSDQFNEMNTSMQFMYVSSSPTKEANFQKLKAANKGNSFYCWHGSPLFNWNSILRDGLKNMSGTKMQIHGAAHGHGIYLARDSQTSYGYSQGGGSYRSGGTQQWGSSQVKGTPKILALCEVIDDKKQYKDYNWGIVVQGEDYVATRFLFVFNDTEPHKTSVTASQMKVPEHLKFGGK